MPGSRRSRRVPRIIRRNRFLYYLFYERPFFAAVGAFLVLVLAAFAFLPKIWIVTPRGFTPEVRVRGLDFLQAAALRRSARNLAEMGSYRESMRSWAAAVANQPADLGTVREAIHTLVQIEPPAPEMLGWGATYGNWLLRLGQTNAADVALVALFYEHQGLDDAVVRLLSSEGRENLTPEEARPYLRALFRLGHPEAFAQAWKRHAGNLAQDPELQLYHSAYLVGWGPPENIADARKALEAAKIAPETLRLAHRLQLQISYSHGDPDAYAASLTRLEQDHGDAVRDHVRLWLLLAMNARVDEARDLASHYASPPANPAEAELMATTLSGLGLREEAAAFLRRHHDSFEYSPTMWMLEGRALVALKRWDDVRELAVNLRQQERLSKSLGGYHHFLTGLAEHSLGRPEPARQSFSGLLTNYIPDHLLAFQAGTTIHRLGYPQIAAEVLGRLEHSFSNRVDFWLQLQSAAHESKQYDLLLAAAEKAYRSAPDNLVFANNYAAALLMQRERSAEAIELTIKVLAKSPRSFEARINHALALLQNSRVDDAEPLLRSLAAERGDAEGRTLLNLAWFEYYQRKGQTTLAWEAVDRIETRFLLQPQLDWLNATRKKLPPRS
jgi:predicted Zn-dependent protease